MRRSIRLGGTREVPYHPLGQYAQPRAHRADTTVVLDGSATFWNVRRA